MDFSEKTYPELNNSLLVAGLANEKIRTKVKTESNLPTLKITDNLGLISALYIYTGTPPHGYGTQGPKVLETVNRTYTYNRKKENDFLNIGGYDLSYLKWEGDGFPHDVVHGNYSLDDAVLMIIKFVSKYHEILDRHSSQLMQKLQSTNSDILTKGRQTLCSLSNQSTTSSVAYKRMYDFFRTNQGRKNFNCLEWIQTYFELFNKKSIEVMELEPYVVSKKKYISAVKQTLTVSSRKYRWRRIVYKGSEATKKLIDLACKFASYIKHKERGKKDRRAIASANVILRMFLYIIEEFHLSIGREIPGSTISIGGEEKKAKIISTLQNQVLPQCSSIFKVQGTEDATKWNECLSPEIFNIMHRYFFDDKIRAMLRLPLAPPDSKTFSHICRMGNLLMALKKIQIGPGPIGYNGTTYSRLLWSDPNSKFNDHTRESWEPMFKYIRGDYILSSPGMLMGMLNAASTTLGLLAQGYGLSEIQDCTTLRSSDDSTTIYSGASSDILADCVEKNRMALSLLGINLSKEKTFFFVEGYSEYTSWYQDKKFLAQYGVETSTLRPQGKNPHDDFYSIAKGTSVSLQTLSINHMGAAAKLLIGLDNVRRLWRIEYDPTKRGLSRFVQVLSDGGENLWHVCNCHLNEISLRRTLMRNENDEKYLYGISNPDNPFARQPEEEISYSIEQGKLISQEIDTPRNIFTYVKRSNRSIGNSIKKVMFNQEKIYGEVATLVKNIIPITMLKYPVEATPMNRQLSAALSIQASTLPLTDDDKKDLEKCLRLLNFNQTEDGDSDDDQDLYDVLDDD